MGDELVAFRRLRVGDEAARAPERRLRRATPGAANQLNRLCLDNIEQIVRALDKASARTMRAAARLLCAHVDANVPFDYADPATPSAAALPAVVSFEVTGASSFKMMLGGCSANPSIAERNYCFAMVEPDLGLDCPPAPPPPRGAAQLGAAAPRRAPSVRQPARCGARRRMHRSGAGFALLASLKEPLP